MPAPSGSSKSSFSPSELAQLEHAFAADPSSDAYRPLAEAYLALGRYMEAMVVCKKGVKAHPETAAARVLLARVYADQGKDKKALEELQGALQVSPTDRVALRAIGALLCKTGDAAAGAEHLKKAYLADPSDGETLEACKKQNLDFRPPAPPPPPLAARGEATELVSLPEDVADPVPLTQKARPENAKASVADLQAYILTAPLPVPKEQPAGGSRAPAADAPPPSYEALAAKYGVPGEESVRAPKGGPARLLVTLALAVCGVVALALWYGISKRTTERDQKINRLLTQMQAELAHDSFASYKKVAEYGEQIVELNSSLFSAHAYLAYANSLRWGEHGEGDLVEKSAREHLARAKESKLEHSHIVAAEAYIKFFSGQAQEAQTDLERFVEENEKRGNKSAGALITSTLGILQMHAGDLDRALKNLKTAQQLAVADPRISAAVGNVLRRQGNEFLAANAYESALRYEKDHAEAQLGVALMGIDAGKMETAEKYATKLISADPPPSSRQLALARMAHSIVLDEKGKVSEANREQALAFEADSRNGELFLMKSRRLFKAGKNDEGVEAIREAIKLDPKRASFYVELARALLRTSAGAKEATTAIQQALRSVPGSPKLLVLLGDAYKADGNFPGAKAQYERALTEAKGRLPEARLALGELARVTKDYAGAYEQYEKAIAEYLTAPDRQAHAYIEMGRIAEEQEDRPKALGFFKKAGVVDPDFAPTYFYIGRMFVSDKDQKKREKAVEIFKQYMTLAPRGPYVEEINKLLANK